MRNIPVLATALVVGIVAAAPITAGSVASAAAAPKPSPAVATKQPLLNIAVGDGRTSVASGDRVTYQIEIRNIGTTSTKQLKISQTLPGGLTLISADHGGQHRAGVVTWLVSLAAAQQSTFTTTVRVGSMPRDLLRLATVACATAVNGRKPLVCATHSDLLAAGAAPAASRPSTRWIWYGLAALIALAIVLAGGVAVWRRRRPGTSDGASTAGLPDQQRLPDAEAGSEQLDLTIVD